MGMVKVTGRRLFRPPPARYLGLAIGQVRRSTSRSAGSSEAAATGRPPRRFSSMAPSLPTTCTASKSPGRAAQGTAAGRQKTGILHARRDTRSHGAQHLLALLHLAGQQARNHFDLVGLLRHHTAHRLLARHLGHMPRGASPASTMAHTATRIMRSTQGPGICHDGASKGCVLERAWGHGAPAEIGNSTLPQLHANLLAQAVARMTWAKSGGRLGIKAGDGSKASSKYTQYIQGHAWVEPPHQITRRNP